MNSVIVEDIKLLGGDGWPGISASIRMGDQRTKVWYRVSEGPVVASGDPWLAVALVAAMKQGESLRLSGAVSPKLLRAVPEIQNVFRIWDRNCRPVPVTAHVASTSGGSESGEVACFFTGGVDSFYTLLRHQSEISALVLVHGFDIPLENEPLRRAVSESVCAIAAEFGKPLIEVETNVRSFTDPCAEWGHYYVGAALASVAHLLSGRFRKVLVASSHHYGDLAPFGSHPMLDSLWSTERVEVVNDGYDATRIEKIAHLATCEVAMRSLRVCWSAHATEYNCGRCSKCLRTMATLRLVGALDRCTSFHHPLDLAKLARLEMTPSRRIPIEEIYEVARASGSDPQLERALRDCLDGVYQRGVLGWPRRVANQLQRSVEALTASGPVPSAGVDGVKRAHRWAGIGR